MKTHRVLLTLAAVLLLQSCATPSPAPVTPDTTGDGPTMTQPAATPLPSPMSGPTPPAVGLIAIADVDGSQDVQNRIPKHQIFTMQPDGTNRVQLTHDSGPQFFQNWMPAWSPDGTKIAYVHHTTDGNMVIKVMDADGSNTVTLTTGGVSLAPAWSPDGALIAYAYKPSTSPTGLKLWLMNADGTNQRAFTTGPDNIDESVPTWSPDGKKIAFTSSRDGGKYRIWVINADGSNPVPLTTAYYDTTLQADIEQKVPAWSPDGKYIAYWQGVEANDPRPDLPRDVWVMRADGSDQRKLAPGDGPAWSPDSATISHPDFSTGQLGLGGISPDGSNKRVLFYTNGSFARASWQPVSNTIPTHPPPPPASPSGVSGGLIALTLRDQNGKLQIFTITPDGTNKKQLTFEGENGRPDWSPDGRWITFISIRDGKAWVAVMDADGSNQQLLVEGAAPDWSPDGEQIAFSRPDERQIAQIWVVTADGSGVRQITQSDTSKVGPSWSPDGKEMVFILATNPGSPTDPQPEIGIMNSDGTNERILTTEDRTNTDGRGTVCETANDANAPAWSPVDNRIAFWSGIENQYGQVWVINSDGTGSQQLTEDCSHRNSDDPSWSPDGTKILFSTGRSGRNELWVMDADGSNEKRLSDIDAGPFPGRASWQPVAAANSGSPTPTSQSEIQYLLFQLGDANPEVPLGNTATIHTKAQTEKAVDEIANTIGHIGDHVNTQLGFTTGPLMFDLTDEQMRSNIANAFAIAEEKDIAVAFHIDDSMFWNRRED
ncbi:MAG: hypothetical protein L0Y58_07445, partial [Verrucomicrobia subdivision 3 bacterium]|nr:hypothetical protein [Limisphaerales bacterium]